MLNIPSTVQDPKYRYKMPRMNLKIESKGNGIKTNIVNLTDVAKHLKTSQQYILKFFGFQKASQTMSKQVSRNNTIYIISGQFTQESMIKVLDKFIQKYICCPKCTYPQMNMLIIDGKIHGKCDSCPFMGQLDNKHKITTFILKNPPKKAQRKKDQKQILKENKQKNNKQKEEDQQTNQKTANIIFDPQTLQFGSEQLANLIQYVRKFIDIHKQEDLDLTSAKLVSELKPLALKKPLYAYILFNACFTVNIVKQLPTVSKLYQNLMKKLVGSSIELQTMLNLQYMILETNKDKDLQKFISTMLMKVYEHNLLSEEFLIEWSKSEIKDIEKNFLFVPARDDQFKKLTQDFIEWMIGENQEEQEQKQA